MTLVSASSTSPPPAGAPSFTIAPDQVIGMLINADHVNLHGFGGVSQNLPFWVPAPSKFEGADSAIAHTRAFLTRLQWAIVIAVACSLLVVASLVFYNQSERSPVSSWSIRSVNANGVIVMVGTDTQAPLLNVPVGAMLPSGELLRSVDPMLQSFSTDSQITVVKK